MNPSWRVAPVVKRAINEAEEQKATKEDQYFIDAFMNIPEDYHSLILVLAKENRGRYVYDGILKAYNMYRRKQGKPAFGGI